MSKKDKDSGDKVAAPPRPQGPLGPWRLSISVLVSLGFTGVALWNAAQTGVDTDMALLRSFGVAFITWIALGRLNRVLASDDADDTPPDDGGEGAVDADGLHSPSTG